MFPPITPRKIKSCSDLSMMTKSDEIIKKELVLGTAFAVSNVLLTGHHHSLVSKDDMINYVSTETITAIANVHYGNSPIIVTAFRMKKTNLLAAVFILPILIRFVTYFALVWIL